MIVHMEIGTYFEKFMLLTNYSYMENNFVLNRKDNMNSMQNCNSVTFYFMKKQWLPNPS